MKKNKGRIFGLPRARNRGPLIISSSQEDAPDVNVEEVSQENEVDDDVLSEMEAQAYLKEPSTPEELFVNYITEMADHIGMSKEEFATSPQARNYARKMGIEEEVYVL